MDLIGTMEDANSPPTHTAAITVTATISYIFSGGMSESRKPEPREARHRQLQTTHKAVYTFYNIGEEEARLSAENGSTGT